MYSICLLLLYSNTFSRSIEVEFSENGRSEVLMNVVMDSLHVSLEEALSKGPPPPGNLAVPIFAQGSLEVELYSPANHDPQTPHARDEIYFVAQGSGMFFDGTSRQPIKPGSFIFVAAGQMHRFEAFSADFAVWVAFYGPKGGEKAGSV